MPPYLDRIVKLLLPAYGNKGFTESQHFLYALTIDNNVVLCYYDDMITFNTNTKSHITNKDLLSYGGSVDWFPIRQDGEVTNIDEFIDIKMSQYHLKTPILIKRALKTVGY